MKAIVSHASVGAFETIVLENKYLRAVIIPELGGRVWELEDRIRGRQWVWHREDVPLQSSPVGAVYDDVWAGGWEELFPNDAPGWFEGRNLLDHGEWWTMRWTAADASSGASAKVRLSAKSSVLKASCSKEFRLASDDATLSVRYQIRSDELQPFHFLFKQHLAINITPDCRLKMPGGRVQAVDPSFGTMLRGDTDFSWPFAGEGEKSFDLRMIPRRHSKAKEFVYVRDLPQSWCGVEDVRQGASIRMDFDSRQLPFVWLFLTYGGWRNLYTAVLEPCSNLPKDLSEAVRLGQSARLEPGQEYKTVVAVTLAGLQERDD
jgi:galactose mutarotase-like enzyme